MTPRVEILVTEVTMITSKAAIMKAMDMRKVIMTNGMRVATLIKARNLKRMIVVPTRVVMTTKTEGAIKMRIKVKGTTSTMMV